jgi:hypothetical protein
VGRPILGPQWVLKVGPVGGLPPVDSNATSRDVALVRMWESYGRLTMFLVILIRSCYRARFTSVVYGGFQKNQGISK